MKIIILIALLLLTHRFERRYAEQFYIAISDLSHQIRVVNESKNRPCTAKKFDYYLTKVDSTVAGLREFQRKYFLMEDQSKHLTEMHCPSQEHYQLIKCLKFFINQSVNGVCARIKERISR